jgi:long-chain acyl-CoA synthetase
MGKANDFKGFEIIKKIFLFKDEFTIENDLVTPTLKVKRHNAKKFFEKEIEDMYNSPL